MLSPLTWRDLSAARQEHERNREVARTVGPPRLDPEPGLIRLEFELLAAELRADLDPERLARLEGHVDLETVDRDGVRLPRAEADVHPLVLRIPARFVDEAPLVECRVQRTVHGGEGVADERLGHSSGVVVCRLQSRDVLDEVDAEQERVVSRERGRERCEEPSALLGVKVPDRASEEGDQPAARARKPPRSRSKSPRSPGREPREAAAIACALLAGSDRSVRGDAACERAAASPSSRDGWSSRFRRQLASVRGRAPYDQRQGRRIPLARKEVVSGSRRELL